MTTVKSHKAIAAGSTFVVHVLFILALLLLLKDCGGAAGEGNGMGGGTGGGYTELDMALLGESPNGGGGTSDDGGTPDAAAPASSPDQNVVTTNDAAPVSIKTNPNTPTNTTTNTNNNNQNTNPKKNIFDRLDDPGDPAKGPGDDPTKTGGDPFGSITGKGLFGAGGGGNGGSGYEFRFFRPMVTKPSLSDVIPDQGNVVVKIVVDKRGNVVSATTDSGDPGTNTRNSQLHRLAEKAARSAKFEADPNNGNNRQGKITIRFILK
ncbi:MAG: TonB family protein [Flavobacteriales bacterium]